MELYPIPGDSLHYPHERWLDPSHPAKLKSWARRKVLLGYGGDSYFRRIGLVYRYGFIVVHSTNLPVGRGNNNVLRHGEYKPEWRRSIVYFVPYNYGSNIDITASVVSAKYFDSLWTHCGLILSLVSQPQSLQTTPYRPL